LTVIGSSLGGQACDILIGAGCVKKIICPYVGAEIFAPIGPFYRMKAEKGELAVFECDEGMYYAGLRAAAQFLPFVPWRGGVGTSFPEVNPEIKLFKDPIKGETLLAIPALEPDIAIVHAACADAYGNVQHHGYSFGDKNMSRAANKTIVEVEKVVSNEEIRKHPERTTIPYADAVVRATYGCHPYASLGFYVEDREHIKEYLAAANAYVSGDKKPFESYLKKYILEPESHADYLERVGIKRLLSLYEF
jgi:glutaconate CoA-transferase subunit A